MPLTLNRIAKVQSSLLERFHRTRIHAFIEKFDRTKPTLVILPGGMGSRIYRTPLSLLVDDNPEADELRAAWMGLDTFLGGALKLQMEAHGSGTFIDSGLDDPYVALPNGPVDEVTIAGFRVSLGSWTPYTTAIKALEGDFNIAVFGFDWRRLPRENADHLAGFLRILENRVAMNHGATGILNDTTLVGHSQGGLVAAGFMREIQERDHPGKRWCKRAVSIGTPFYGTLNHHARYYLGEGMLKLVYDRRTMAELVSTMPGLFTLIYPSKAVYERDFVNRPNPELTRYPLEDEEGRPIYPTSQRAFDRFWPDYVPKRLVRRAESDRERFVEPLPAPLHKRFFHIRQGGDRKSPIQLQWKPWPGHFDPNPKTFDLLAPPDGDDSPRSSDGTVPYWSARLVGTPDENVLDYVAQDVGHREIMCHPETLHALTFLERNGHWPSRAQQRNRGRGFTAKHAYRVETIDGMVQEIHEAARRLGNVDNLEAKLLEQDRVGEIVSDPRFWFSLDEGATP